jgi:LPS export ABC transporter protein LptC/lipopolysaccharide transport protein LptA
MQYLRRGALGAAWFVVVLLWPLETNRFQFSGVGPGASPRDGLYQSNLTKANFGLLGVDFYETSEGRKHWNIRSDFAELHRRENYAFLKQVDADFFAEKTGNLVNTTSDFGRSWLDKRLVHLEGNVLIHSRQGYLFAMNAVDYTGATHQFHSTDWVTMRGPDLSRPTMYLRGIGLTADIDREHFLLKRKVSARKKLAGQEWLRITSQSGEFFTNESVAVFTGKVKSVMPKIDIDSDEFRLTSNKDKEFIAAKGNVTLRNRDRVGTAESAYIELGGDRIELAGKARVGSKGNEVTGHVIRIYTDDDRIEVEQAQGKVVD